MQCINSVTCHNNIIIIERVMECTLKARTIMVADIIYTPTTYIHNVIFIHSILYILQQHYCLLSAIPYHHQGYPKIIYAHPIGNNLPAKLWLLCDYMIIDTHNAMHRHARVCSLAQTQHTRGNFILSIHEQVSTIVS